VKSQHVVFVCTGNICRSPTAHAVLRQRIAERGLDGRLSVDSAGLEAWHAGQPPDARSIHHARQRGYDMSALRARQFSRADFDRADWVLAMDEAICWAPLGCARRSMLTSCACWSTSARCTMPTTCPTRTMARRGISSMCST